MPHNAKFRANPLKTVTVHKEQRTDRHTFGFIIIYIRQHSNPIRKTKIGFSKFDYAHFGRDHDYVVNAAASFIADS